MRSLQRRLAGPSRAQSGWSPDEARALLLVACDDAVGGTIKAAVASFTAQIEAPLQAWVIAEPVQFFWLPDRLIVGRTIYSRQLPRNATRGSVGALQRFVPPIASTRVFAHGATTAKVLARVQFAESGAVLDLATQQAEFGSEITFSRRADGIASFHFQHGGWVLDSGLVNGTRLVPPYLQLSRAAARDEDRRSDWERRLLAAARWFSRARRSPAAADRLASGMVALECLFVEGRHERNKGDLIAQRLTAQFRLREKSEAVQIEWLRQLYQRRNDALHEGRDFVDDLEVDRLVDVTQFITRRLALHLIPAHRSRGRSCRTFEETMRCIRSTAA